MKLMYIILSPYESDLLDESYAYFRNHTAFVSNFLSRQVRKLSYNTDGTFNMISVTPMRKIVNEFRIMGNNVLKVELGCFSEHAFWRMSETEKYEYYLKLLEDGYKVAAKHKEIPLRGLLLLNQQFRDGSYKNEWQYKRKVLKDIGVDIILNCYFTSKDFHLELKVISRKTKEEIISGTVFRTEPDEIFFSKEFKNIVIDNNHIIITDFLDRPRFMFNLKNLLCGEFDCKTIGDSKYFI